MVACRRGYVCAAGDTVLHRRRAAGPRLSEPPGPALRAGLRRGRSGALGDVRAALADRAEPRSRYRRAAAPAPAAGVCRRAGAARRRGVPAGHRRHPLSPGGVRTEVVLAARRRALRLQRHLPAGLHRLPHQRRAGVRRRGLLDTVRRPAAGACRRRRHGGGGGAVLLPPDGADAVCATGGRARAARAVAPARRPGGLLAARRSSWADAGARAVAGHRPLCAIDAGGRGGRRRVGGPALQASPRLLGVHHL